MDHNFKKISCIVLLKNEIDFQQPYFGCLQENASDNIRLIFFLNVCVLKSISRCSFRKKNVSGVLERLKLVSQELNHFCILVHGFSQGVKNTPTYLIQPWSEQNIIKVVNSTLKFIEFMKSKFNRFQIVLIRSIVHINFHQGKLNTVHAPL